MTNFRYNIGSSLANALIYQVLREWSAGRNPFFGERWDAPATDGETQMPTPTDSECYLCHRKIVNDDQGWYRRMIVGSQTVVGVAHRGCEMGTQIGHSFGFCSCTGYEDLYERGQSLIAHLDHV